MYGPPRGVTLSPNYHCRSKYKNKKVMREYTHLKKKVVDVEINDEEDRQRGVRLLLQK